jgi:hypothetical protein
MPFIKRERRKMIDKDQYYSISKTEEGIQVGDRCYFYYRRMVDRWRDNPRWTTAHNIFKDMLNDELMEVNQDDFIASRLAWQVFFLWWVVPYEKLKERENSPIE